MTFLLFKTTWKGIGCGSHHSEQMKADAFLEVCISLTSEKHSFNYIPLLKLFINFEIFSLCSLLAVCVAVKL